ncbi:hypothetical protein NX059_001636 [Plenodomus lindquistii]|nr:hypothetical protein NX059_001636 [Plenodomus lindquistii]
MVTSAPGLIHLCQVATLPHDHFKTISLATAETQVPAYPSSLRTYATYLRDQTDEMQFPDRHDRPGVKAWRCDLTALSQIYNLYFLACNDTIHVYQPSFPDQALLSEPHLILELPVSPRTGSGIDPQDPHSVTRVLVDYLGCDEVLLVACDDGDVVGFRVDDIQRCIDERMQPPDEQTVSYLEASTVKHFLHRNVGASAWGLAIHRAARIIAISANTHRITVLAFALSQPLLPCVECLGASGGNGSTKPLDLLAVKAQSLRNKDFEFELVAETNIPAVSFNNTGDDPSGHWLFSCSIDGAMKAWDLHNPHAPHAVFRLGYCTSATLLTNRLSAPRVGPGLCACSQSGNIPHGVWGALPLDTCAAYEISPQERDSLEISSEEPCFKVISPRKERFTNRGLFLNILDQQSGILSPEARESDDIMVLDDDSEAGSATSEGEDCQKHDSQLELAVTSSAVPVDNEHEGDNYSPALAHAAQVADPSTTSHAHESPPSSDVSMGPSSDAGSEPGSPDHSMQQQILQHLVMAQSQAEAATANQAAQEDTDMSDESDSDIGSVNIGPFFPYPLPGHLQERRAYCEINTYTPWFERPLDTSIRPLLVVTKEEIYLIERPSPSSRNDPPDNIVTMRRPIHPNQIDTYLAPYDRLCYFTQIPELGLFIVASPIGRAAVFSLWYTRAESNNFEPEYGFDLEYILPFDRKDNTRLGHVPDARLLGIAVSPVQGMLDKIRETEEAEQEQGVPKSRRWRLLMYFTDHTVLGFELSKKSQGETPDVSELVV